MRSSRQRLGSGVGREGHEPSLEDIFLTFCGGDEAIRVNVFTKNDARPTPGVDRLGARHRALVLLYASFYPSIKANASG
jgi:hypothetical protein